MEYIIKKEGTERNVLEMKNRYHETQDNVASRAAIAYGDDALLIHMELDAPEIRNVEEGPLGRPCVDSCLEFFFCPMEGDDRYFNIEFNIGGCLCFGLGDGNGLSRFTVADPAETLSFKSVRTDKGFYIDYKMPYSIIRRIFPDFKVYSGKKIKANCYSCAERTQVRHFLSWSLIDDKKFSFHRPECFGTMIFE